MTEAPERPSPIRLATVWVPLIILAAGFALRIIRLGHFSFDGDEIFSIRAVTGSWSHLFSMAINDVSHPPLFYLLLKLWLSIGPVNEVWVRLLPASLGSLALLPLYGICNRLRFDEADKIFVCGIFAVNGSLIYYSQDARDFSLLVLTSILSLYVFVGYVQATSSAERQSAALIGSNILLVYSHYWGWLVLISEGAVLLLFSRAKFGRFVHYVMWVAAAFVPWAFAVLLVIFQRGNATSQIHWITEPTNQDLGWLLGDIVGAPNFHHATVFGLLLFAMPIGAALYRLALDKRYRGEFRVSLLAWFVLFALPIFLTRLAGWISGQSVWGERQLLIVFAPFYVLVGVVIGTLPWKKLAILTQAIILLWSVAGGAAVTEDTHQKLQWRSLAEVIVGSSRTGHAIPIYAAEAFENWPLSYYLEKTNGHASKVLTQPDPNSIPDRSFWFVYRPNRWHYPQSPESMFRAKGLFVDQRTSTVMRSQSVVALLMDERN